MMGVVCVAKGGEILATAGIQAAYETGRGGVTVRGRAFIEEEQPAGSRRGAKKVAKLAGGRPVIVITELPYQTNKAAFVADVARLVDEQKLTGRVDRVGPGSMSDVCPCSAR